MTQLATRTPTQAEHQGITRCLNAVHAGTYDNPACRSCQCVGRPKSRAEMRALFGAKYNEQVAANRGSISGELNKCPGTAAHGPGLGTEHVGGVHAR